MKIGREMAGFTLGQTDILRRAMGKKLVDKIEKQRGPFLDGARAKGIDPKIANDVFESMIPFAGYCFNQSHSTAYALITYQTAYLKIHYPLEFMAAGMTNAMRRNDSSASTAEIIKYVKECQSQDMVVLPPDVNESYNEFVIRGGSIRFGLGAVKNVGESAVESIVAAREAGEPFKSIFDFCERVDLKAVNRKCIESLIKCGVFDTLDGHRAQFLAALDTAIEAGQSAQRDKAVGQASLFDFSDSFSADIQKLPNVPRTSDSEVLAMEKEMLGFYISGHPLLRCEQLIKEYTNASSSTFEDIEDGEPITICGMVASIRNHTTKNDKRMAFVTLEDLEGTVDLVVFSEALESCSDAIQEGNIVWVKGHTGNGKRARENISILVDEILSLDDARQKFSTSVHVRLPLTMLESSALESLKGVFADNKGGCNLFLHFQTSQYDEVVIQANPDTKVSPTEVLISQVEKMVGEQCVWLGNSH
jgi:DNA polymerase-3 subunit alpha